MDGAPNQPLMDALLLRYEVEQFFNHEAELLDSRQFEAWLDLLAEDIRYWMPLTRNQEFGKWQDQHTRAGKDLNWFDEGKFELEQRVKQIMTGLHWAEEPVSRTCHMVSNLQVDDAANGRSKRAAGSWSTGTGRRPRPISSSASGTTRCDGTRTASRSPRAKSISIRAFFWRRT